jgi:arylsulfatase A-like enzyme
MHIFSTQFFHNASNASLRWIKYLLSLSFVLLILSHVNHTLHANPKAKDLVYHLQDNLPHAHRYHNGLILDFTDISIVKYLREAKRSWKRYANFQGREAMLPNGIKGDLWIPVTPDLAGNDLSLDIVLAPIGARQRLDIFVDKDKVAHFDFKSTKWQTINTVIPASKMKNRIQKIRFHFRTRHKVREGLKSPAAFHMIRLANRKNKTLSAKANDLKVYHHNYEKKKIALVKDHGLDYYIVPQAKSLLKGNVSKGSLLITMQQTGRSNIISKNVSGSFELDLTKLKGQPTRLMIRATENSRFTAKIGQAQANKMKVKKPKYVVFWLIDTLRADKLQFYKQPNANSRPKVETPNLSALAKTATIFDPFYVQGNESKASHASLFTGVYPVKHGVYTHKAKLGSNLTTIAEVFSKSGYHTGGFVSNGYVSDQWNFDQGFKTFTNFIREEKANNAKAVVKAATRFIKKRKKKPFYLYLGTSDPHVTYRAHKQFLKTYDKGKYTGRYKKNITGGELGKLKGKKPPSKRDQKRIEALYENEIAFNDYHFGQLVKVLKAEGIYDDTMIIISADHGDEFWEHGSCGHGHSLYQELISVPLMIHWPKGFPQTRFTLGTDGIDLLATLTDMLGKKQPKTIQGRSLLPQLKSSKAYYQAMLASKGQEMYAIAVGPAKVIYRGKGLIESYHLKRDKNESKNLYKKDLILTLSALDPLTLYLLRPKSWKKVEWGAANDLNANFPKKFPKNKK